MGPPLSCPRLCASARVGREAVGKGMARDPPCSIPGSDFTNSCPTESTSPQGIYPSLGEMPPGQSGWD